MEGKEVFVNPNVNEYAVKNIIYYKLDENGEKKWENIIQRDQNSSFSYITSIKELNNGDFITAGQFWEGDNQNASILKLSKEGDLLWQRFYSYPDKKYCKIYDMEILENGSILLAGVNSSPQEGWMLAVDSLGCLMPNCVTSIEYEEIENDFISIDLYPNPVNHNLNIHFKSIERNSHGTFQVLSNTGQVMKKWKNDKSDHFIIIDVSEFLAGSYYLQYVNNGKTTNRKFIKS